MSLQIKNLHVTVEKKEIVKDLSLTIEPGEVHVIMGPNGSGKSTLANALMGNPEYTTTKGDVILDGTNITNLSPDKKAQAGLFLSPQYPPEINGVSVGSFLRLTKNALTKTTNDPLTFRTEILAMMEKLHIPPEFLSRSLNTGFSGGEKKKMEILQLLILNPIYAILDETDSGLDVDALKIVAEGINAFKTKEKGLVLITHYQRLLDYIVPDVVHIMREGKIVKSGGKKLVEEIETEGFGAISKS
jgi:Fe-S cluster assembly ATP-binding protein